MNKLQIEYDSRDKDMFDGQFIRDIALNHSPNGNFKLDSRPPGCNKSTDTINKIIETYKSQSKTILILPMISEIGRYQSEIYNGTNGEFVLCEPIDDKKGTALFRLLIQGKSIITTHSLIQKYSKSLSDSKLLSGYDVIIDERYTHCFELDTTVATNTFKRMINETEEITISNDNKIELKTKYDESGEEPNILKLLNTLEKSDIYIGDDKLSYFVKVKNIEYLKQAKTVTVLSYMFRDSDFVALLEFNKCNYILMDDSIYSKETKQLINNYHINIQNKINIVDDIGFIKFRRNTTRNLLSPLAVRGGLSTNSIRFYDTKSHKPKSYMSNECKKSLLGTISTWIDKSVYTQNDTLVTCNKYLRGYGIIKKVESRSGNKFIGSHGLIPKGMINEWTSQDTVGTNKFSHKHLVCYITNSFYNPYISRFVKEYMNYDIDDDMFSLSQINQFVFRSAIRNGEYIDVIIPSQRQRELYSSYISSSDGDYK